ncbi:MAG: hypothetical protein IT343_05495 [Candidatus Melainabacteria bacterium]|jgi:hypothetical protein|nr:hypothetical protein [Candidatus Melainabacteria bacterium]
MDESETGLGDSNDTIIPQPQSTDTGDNGSLFSIFMPQSGGWFFAYLLGGMLFMRPEMFLWDGGTCRHIINGEYWLANHALPTTNYTSAIFNSSPCLTRCWLGDITSGTAFSHFGMTGIVLIFSIVGALGLMWSYQMARARGMGLLAGMVLVLLVMPAVGMHWSARCHVYTYLPFLILYYLVFMSTHKIAVRAVATALVMCLWANLHGSYTVGVVMLAVSMGAAAIGGLLAKADVKLPCIEGYRRQPGVEGRLKPVSNLAILAACGGIATALNPRGMAFYNTIFTYMSNPVVLSKTDEWRSFDITAGVGAWFFLVLAGITIYAIWKTKGGLTFHETAVMCVFFVASIISMRFVPYCALMVIPFLAPYWQLLRPKLLVREQTNPLTKGLAKLAKVESGIESSEPKGWKPALLYIVATIIMGIAFLSLDYCKVKDFDPTRIPVKLVECLAKENPPGLGFNYDNWGGYIYFKLKRTVYIDDWADFLPPEFIEEYLKILLTQDNWEEIFNKRNFTWVMVPKEAQLAQVLSQRKDWEVKCKDDVGVFLVRKPAP